jgi:hypothetical protein
MTADAAADYKRSEALRSDDINVMSQAEGRVNKDAAIAHHRGSGDVISAK